MYLLTEEGLSLLLKRIRNKIALRTTLDTKVDKEEGKDLSDNDFTDNHINLLNSAINSVSVEYSTGKSHITFLNNEINNNIELDINTDCDVFFYPVIRSLRRELDGSATIPYAYISKEGCDIGKVSVTMDYLGEENIDSTTQTFEINGEENGELVLTNVPDKTGQYKLSFTLSGDTDAFKSNFLEHTEILIKVFASYRSSTPDLLPGWWYSADDLVNEELEDGTYKIPVYGQEGNTSVTFANYKDLYEIYYIANHVTDMHNAFHNCTNLVGSPICGPNVTNMVNAYRSCWNLKGPAVCGDKVTNFSLAYSHCYDLVGPPVCGSNVTNMSSAYMECINLTGSPVCGNNVTNISYTYQNCQKITGSPVCGPNVGSMYSTYYNCSNLTGSPVCGDSVTNLYNAYYNCRNLTGQPACGNNVTNMVNTYAFCHNLTGSPVCGLNVTNMYNTYYNCINLTGEPACGPNVISMYSTYNNCCNLTGSPACGNNVTNMRCTYYKCNGLTGAPVSGPNVTDMSTTYYNCFNLTGSPACGPNVTNMLQTYLDCSKLTGDPVCGNNVTTMSFTYYNCHNLTGPPVCGPNVTNISSTYSYCYNITGSPVCGNYVTNMNSTYCNCYKLTGLGVCGPNVTTMYYAYYSCNNLTSVEVGPMVTNTDWAFTNCHNVINVNMSNGTTIIGESMFRNCAKIGNITIPSSITSIRPNAFNGCSNLTSYDFGNHTAIPALNGPSAFDGINSQCMITVPTSLYSDWIEATNWKSYANYIVPNSTEPGIISIENDIVELDINKTKTIDIMIVNFEDVNSINVSAVSDKTACVSIGNITKVQKNAMCAIISVELITTDLEEDTNITLTVSSATATVDYTFVAKVEEVVVSYSVESVSGATYGFALNADGYYESQNKGVHSSYAICKVEIINPNRDHKVFVDCINHGESGCDYGLLSNVGSTLSLSTTADSSGVKKNFSNSSSTSVQTVSYGIVEGTIYIKFRKDSSANSGNDSLQFKIRFEYVDPNAPGGSFVVESVDGASYGFKLGDDGYYVNQNINQSGSYALCKVIINNPLSQNVIFQCNQSSESGYDYGLLSNVGSTFALSSSADSSGVMKSCKNLSGDFTVEYGAVEGTIYVKYRKDSSVDNGTDTFKFTVEFE